MPKQHQESIHDITNLKTSLGKYNPDRVVILMSGSSCRLMNVLLVLVFSWKFVIPKPRYIIRDITSWRMIAKDTYPGDHVVQIDEYARWGTHDKIEAEMLCNGTTHGYICATIRKKCRVRRNSTANAIDLWTKINYLLIDTLLKSFRIIKQSWYSIPVKYSPLKSINSLSRSATVNKGKPIELRTLRADNWLVNLTKTFAGALCLSI